MYPFIKFALVVLILVLPISTVGQERTYAVPGDEECPVPLPKLPKTNEPWTKSERWAWKRICLGQQADMSLAESVSWEEKELAGSAQSDGKVCQPWEIEGEQVPNHRKLRPAFIELILTRLRWAQALRSQLVSIRCAVIDGPLILENAVVPSEFELLNTHLRGRIDLEDARFDRTLAFDGSRVEGDLNASGLSVKGSLFLRDGASFNNVVLRGAEIADDVSAIGSSFRGTFDADSLSVGDDLFFRDDASFKDVILRGADVAGQVSAVGSRFEGTFNANSLFVGTHLFLRGGALFKDVYLRGAEVEGVFDATGSRFEGELAAGVLTIGHDLFLRGGASFQRIDLTGAEIGGQLQLAGSSIAEIVSFSGGSAKELVLFRDNTKEGFQADSNDPIWRDGARLVLRNASVAALQSRPASWRTSSGWLAADLGGFTYNRLAGFRAGASEALVNESAADLVCWIRGVTNALHKGKAENCELANLENRYYPQPYEQLASVLTTAGMKGKADKVRYEKFRHRDATLSGSWWQVYLLRPASRFIVGYGVYPFRALWWFGALVILGVFVTFFSHAELLKSGNRKFWYSLETALPLFAISDAHKSVNHGRDWIENWFHFQRVAGFVLATVLVGALTLLAG